MKFGLLKCLQALAKLSQALTSYFILTSSSVCVLCRASGVCGIKWHASCVTTPLVCFALAQYPRNFIHIGWFCNLCPVQTREQVCRLCRDMERKGVKVVMADGCVAHVTVMFSFCQICLCSLLNFFIQISLTFAMVFSSLTLNIYTP